MDKIIKHAVDMTKEGVSAGAGFVGAGIVGTFVEQNVTPALNITNPWIGALTNFAGKYLAYSFANRVVGRGEVASNVQTGIAANAALDLALRLQTGGVQPSGPTLFGYNILTGVQNPDQAGYGSMPMDYAERQKRFGSVSGLPVPPRVAERQRQFGSMPFVQNPAITGRERKFGFSASPSDTDTYAMFGML